MNLLQLVQINLCEHHCANAIVSSSASFIKVYKFNTGGGVLPVMAYMRRLCPKGVPFSGFKCMKGQGFYKMNKPTVQNQQSE